MIVWKDMSGFSAGGLLSLFPIVLSPFFPVAALSAEDVQECLKFHQDVA